MIGPTCHTVVNALPTSWHVTAELLRGPNNGWAPLAKYWEPGPPSPRIDASASPSSIIWYRPKGGYALWLGRSGVALAMSQTQWYTDSIAYERGMSTPLTLTGVLY